MGSMCALSLLGSLLSVWLLSAAYFIRLQTDNWDQRGQSHRLFLAPDNTHTTLFCCAWGNVAVYQLWFIILEKK